MISNLNKAFCLALGLFLAGCSFRPNLPNVEMDGQFTYQYDKYTINDRWWEDFGDAKLNNLVESALKNNTDLLVALNNIERARVNMRLAKLEYLPNTNLQGSATRNRTSSETYQSVENAKYNNFSLSGALSYEIDLWGKVRNTVAAKEATFKANQYDFQNSRLSVAAQTVETYFTLISLNEQEQILKNSLKTYMETLDYRKNELENGAITELVYYQAKVSVDSAYNQLVTLRDSIVQAQVALSILVGKTPNEILNGDISAPRTLPNAPEVPEGVSADILSHRADVAKALETLKASNALIGVARAKYFPSISLTGAFGYASKEFDRFFTANAATWSMGGSLAMPLLDFGRTYSNVELAELDQNASVLNYDKVLKTAFGEIRKALDLRQNSVSKEKAARNLANSQQRVFDLSKTRYNEGYTTHLEYLDAQRLLLSSRLELAKARLNVLNSVVSVYKALGGGFTVQTSN